MLLSVSLILSSHQTDQALSCYPPNLITVFAFTLNSKKHCFHDGSRFSHFVHVSAMNFFGSRKFATIFCLAD